MILDRFENSALAKVKEICGLHLFIEPNGSHRIHFVHLQQQKSDLVVLAEAEIETLEELTDSVPKQIPIVLNVDGRGLIHKLIRPNSTETNFLIKQVMPNAQAKDFALQYIPLTQNRAAISLVRHSSLDEILKQFEKLSLQVIALYLGPALLHQYHNLLRLPDTFCVSQKQLQFSSDGLTELKPMPSAEQHDFVFGKQRYPATVSVPLASAIQYFAGLPFAVETPRISNAHESFIYKNLIKNVGIGILVLFFVLLLGNYMAYMHFSQKNNELGFQLNTKSQLVDELNTKEKDLKSKQAFVRSLGLGSWKMQSFYIDRIASSLPKGMKLEVLKSNPLVGKLKENEEPIFGNQKLRFYGYAEKADKISRWIDELEHKGWIKDVDIIDVQQKEDAKGVYFWLTVEVE